MISKKQKRRINILERKGNDADLVVLEAVEELEELLEKFESKIPDLGTFLANVRGEDGTSIEEIKYEDGTLSITNSEGEKFEWYIRGEDGKDAEVTDELIEKLVSLTKAQITDHTESIKKLEKKIQEVEKKKKIVKETVIEREVIPNTTIDEIKESNRKDLEEISKKITEQFPTENEIREKIKEIMPKNPPDYAGGSGATFLKSLRDVDTKDRSETNAYLKWNPTTKKYEHVEVASGGSSVSVNGVEVTDPDFINSTTINFSVAGSDVSATVNDDSITNAKQAKMSKYTVKSNLTAGTANPADNTLEALNRDLNVGPSVSEIAFVYDNDTSTNVLRPLGQVGSSILGTLSVTANRIYMGCFYEYGERTIERLVLEVTANVSLTSARLAIFKPQSDGLPATLVAQTNEIIITGTGIFAQTGLSIVLPAGQYFCAYIGDGSATIRATQFSQSFGQPSTGGTANYRTFIYNYTYASLPSTLTASSLSWNTGSFATVWAGYSALTTLTKS